MGKPQRTDQEEGADYSILKRVKTMLEEILKYFAVTKEFQIKINYDATFITN